MNDLSFFTTDDGVRLAYRLDGDADKPVLMLSNSIATTMDMWQGQVPVLSEHFRVLRHDTRGHGASGVPDGGWSLDRLGRDVIELLDALDIERVHFLGLSLGGIIGQWLGTYAPERIDRLVLSNTSDFLGPADQWDQRIAAVLAAPDMTASADMFLANWFPAWMLEAQEPIVEEFRAMVMSTERKGVAGAYAVVRDMDLRRSNALISRPTLVIAGQYDAVTLASHSERIAETIVEARLVLLPAVHLSNIEYPVEFVETVLEFLLSP